MLSNRIIRPFAAATFVLLAGMGVCNAQESSNADLQRELAKLRERNRTLEKALVESNRAEKEASEQLAQVRTRLEALGKNLLEGGDERLIQATSDIQILNERLAAVEASAMQLSGAVYDFLDQALASDPDSRLRLESALRELDSVIGLMQKPGPAAQATGTARRAVVISIDSESGLLVLNIGEKQGARIGTTYSLMRGDQTYGTAIIADVRKHVAGAFVESLEPDQGPVRIGDNTILVTE